jgi:hypothetical protein
MAKNNKKGGLKTAQTETVNEVIETTVEQVKTTAQPTTATTTTMDRNHQVDMLKIMHETFHPTHDPDAAAHTGFSQETVDKMNRLKALGIAVVFGQEVAFGNSDFAMIFRKADLPELKEAMAEIGMKLDETKLIETKENTDAKNIQVPSIAVTVSDETKEQLKKDAEATKASQGKTYDPTKIKDEAELKEALSGILAINRDEKLIESIYKAISFWLAYQKVTANKANDKDRIQELNSMSNVDIFQEVVNLTGRTGTLCYGLANHIFLQTASTGSPVSAWCCLYSSSINKETNICKYANEELADIIKCLVKYEANNIRAKALATIEEENKLPEKDRVQSHIDTANKNIAYADKATQAVVLAPSEFVTTLKEKYLAKDNFAHKTVICIKKAFYGDIDAEKMSTVKIDSLLNNCTTYAGIISNLFRDPNNQLDGYSADKVDHLEFKTAEEISAEKAEAEKAAAEAAEKKAKEDAEKKAAGLKKKAKEEKKKQVKK